MPDLVDRVRAVVPLLRSNARRCTEERRVPRENLDALRETGVYRAGLPRHLGGLECDMRTKLAALAEIGRGCGSTSWVSAIYTDAAFLLTKFPDDVQEEVFADAEAFFCATLAVPGRAVAVDGGYSVSGRWPFSSGCRQAARMLQPAVVEGGELAHFLIPAGDLTIEDDWYVSGMEGTGSNTVSGQDVFIPHRFAIPTTTLLDQRHHSERNAGSPFFRHPPLPYLLTSAVATFLGMAEAAHEFAMERLPRRGQVAYTGYAHHRDAATTHHQVAETRMKIDAARLLADQVAALMDDRVATGVLTDQVDRARIWGHVGYASRLCTEAVEVLRLGSGASGIATKHPIHQISRDIQALATHAIMVPTTGIEHYGRALCGVDPSTPLL
ncbi:acyl-CoA dehydrogenase family protein [Actinosynnema sp. NPDC047251]|uniref:Acyl-CoA dehydrogenase n=1 Tax=Saccharothrix espanaensis (strain ATCC 51144 / DSM 44229 / JCM 9112 / NBRC 15066 / NRRL 15764) TaxID=1179773 RepID=K0JY38_SACES|nr:acyl-CoA dehydrogenase family protein [Saccharothrix espanaensis]CCH30257.1 Acyl-CoA dehydrogenase [Saccharothrix espanaensis DSM 44229]